MRNEIAVTILNWNRKELLENTLLSFLRHHMRELDGLKMLVLDNGSFDGSRDFLDHFGFWHRKIYLDGNVGNGEGTSLLMDAFLGTGCSHVLHLENDWRCLRGGFLPSCLQLLEENDDVGCVRLSNKNYRPFNEVDKLPLEWSGPYRCGADDFMIADCHYTFNPMLITREVVKGVFPCAGEAAAQKAFYGLGFKIAQIQEPKCFEHIGHQQKQSFQSQGVRHTWTK